MSSVQHLPGTSTAKTEAMKKLPAVLRSACCEGDNTHGHLED